MLNMIRNAGAQTGNVASVTYNQQKQALASFSYLSAAWPWCLSLTCLNNPGCASISMAPISLT